MKLPYKKYRMQIGQVVTRDRWLAGRSFSEMLRDSARFARSVTYPLVGTRALVEPETTSRVIWSWSLIT